MSEKYNPVAFDPRTFAEEAGKRDPAFREAYEGMADEFAALAELLRARTRAGLTQSELAERMHTTQSTIARLEENRGLSPIFCVSPIFCASLRTDSYAALNPEPQVH